jgi:hypothetical protein
MLVSNLGYYVRINVILYRRHTLKIMQSRRLTYGWSGEVEFS